MDLPEGEGPFNLAFYRYLADGTQELIYVKMLDGRITKAEWMIPDKSRRLVWRRDKRAWVQLALKGEMVGAMSDEITPQEFRQAHSCRDQ